MTALAFGQTPVEPNSRPDKEPYALVDLTRQKFTGDLDGMIQRRIIRVLVPYSKTHYFVEKVLILRPPRDFHILSEAFFLNIHALLVPVQDVPRVKEMECPKCQVVNEEGSKFCLECGQKLELLSTNPIGRMFDRDILSMHPKMGAVHIISCKKGSENEGKGRSYRLISLFCLMMENSRGEALVTFSHMLDLT
jgi:hypothetical protein